MASGISFSTLRTVSSETGEPSSSVACAYESSGPATIKVDLCFFEQNRQNEEIRLFRVNPWYLFHRMTSHYSLRYDFQIRNH